MQFADLIYPTLVYVHLLLFVLWLGCGRRRVSARTAFSQAARSIRSTSGWRLLKLLVIVDLTPRTAWALMVPMSLTVSYMGGWWDLPPAIVGFVAWTDCSILALAGVRCACA